MVTGPQRTIANTDQGYSLQLGSFATPEVRATLNRAVRPHLHDVRAMLRLPMPEVGITAGCNFAAVHVLVNVISGLSRLMGPSHSNSGKAFIAFVRRWYPWKMEPSLGYRAQRGSDTLYKQFRTGFVHDLGLLLDSVPLKQKGKQRSTFRLKGKRLGVSKLPSLSSRHLEELDDTLSRPSWLAPTVSSDGPNGVLVDAAALYLECPEASLRLHVEEETHKFA